MRAGNGAGDRGDILRGQPSSVGVKMLLLHLWSTTPLGNIRGHLAHSIQSLGVPGWDTPGVDDRSGDTGTGAGQVGGAGTGQGGALPAIPLILRWS